MLKPLNQRDSSTLKLIAGLAKHVRETTCSNSAFLLNEHSAFHTLVAGFSMGPRNCIGQRFAMAETVCVLALLVRSYEVLVPASLEGKTIEEKESQMMTWVPGFTSTPTNARVRVKRRSN